MKKTLLLFPILFLIYWSCEEQDTTPPTVSITSPVSGQSVNEIVTITVTTQDNEGIDRVEFYIDDLMPLFETKFDFILDLNFKCFEILQDSLQLELNISESAVFEKEPLNKIDYRPLVKRNYEANNLEYYTQVFTEKHGFIPNLSILDLLFNEGPNTELYLTRQSVNLC